MEANLITECTKTLVLKLSREEVGHLLHIMCHKVRHLNTEGEQFRVNMYEQIMNQYYDLLDTDV